MSIQEAAQSLHTSPARVRGLIRSYRLRVRYRGGSVDVDTKSIYRAIYARRNK